MKPTQQPLVPRHPGLFSLSIATLAILSSFGLLSGCSQQQDAHASMAPPPAMPVSVAAVIARPVAEQREFSGRVEAVEHAELRPRVAGYIVSVGFKPGSLVKKGDVLFTIDPRPYQAEAARAEAAAASSRARADLAKTELDRSRRLLADNAIAQRDYDERAANQRQLEATARADAASLQTAQLNLAWTSVRAPISGRVSKAEVTEGNLVDGNTVLTSIVSADPIYVSFTGDEATYLQLGKTARNHPGSVKLNAGLSNEAGFPHEGRLEFIDNRVDPASGSVRLRALVRNPDGLLTPGLYARVQMSTDAAGGAPSTLVAERAIGTDQSRKFVFVLNDKNQADYRPVQLGSRQGDLRVITSGLKAGERVVVDGLQRVRPGAPLSPQVVPMEGAASGAAASSAPAQQ